MFIAEKLIQGRRYYYLQRSVRIKDKNGGTSRVKTSSTYLGKAENLLERLNQNKRPLEIDHKEFGFIAALMRMSQDLGLIDLLQEHIPGSRYGLPRWIYFFLTTINRLQQATSKEQIGAWSKKTILPDYLEFDADELSGRGFWYATEDVVSEADLTLVRQAKQILSQEKLRPLKEANPAAFNDLFAGVDDSTFHKITDQLFAKIKDRFGISEASILYDTTNFFTYIDEPTGSELARTGHNKESRHHLRQIGLALAVDKAYGVPFFYRVYRGNSHDSKTFAAVVDELIQRIKNTFSGVEELVLILDKGNNSKENFNQLNEKINWVGSLVPSQYPQLVDRDETAFNGQYKDILFFSIRRKIMGFDCLVVSTYRPSLARKQEFTLQCGLAKLTNEIQSKWQTYKKRPTSVPPGIKSMLKASRYGKFLRLDVCQDQLIYAIVDSQRNEARLRFGKNLLFTDKVEASAEWVIANYQGKNKIEDSFKLIKGTGLIRFRPIRHYTDSKISAFAFCCVVALMLMKAVELLCIEAGLKMSPELIKEELTDIKAITLVYSPKDVQMEITRRSSVQQKLWDLFRLEEIAKELPYTA